jgi:hypothetical protein
MLRRSFLHVALVSLLSLFFHSNTLAQTADCSKTIAVNDLSRKKSGKKEKLTLAPSTDYVELKVNADTPASSHPNIQIHRIKTC